MILAQALELVEPWDFAPPGPAALEHLRPASRGRYASLNVLKAGEARFCVWCNVVQIPAGMRKYCSERCSRSARRYTNPQHPAVKAWIFIVRQRGACAYCGLSFEEEIVARISSQHRYLSNSAFHGNPRMVPWYYVGAGTGDRWHVDHVIPLHQGGQGIGFENIQVICVRCHKRKTIEDRRPEVSR